MYFSQAPIDIHFHHAATPLMLFPLERRRACWFPSPCGARVTRSLIRTRRSEELGFVTPPYLKTLVILDVQNIKRCLMTKWMHPALQMECGSDETASRLCGFLVFFHSSLFPFFIAPMSLEREPHKHKSQMGVLINIKQVQNRLRAMDATRRRRQRSTKK